MKTMQATDAKNNFGKLIEDCITEPVSIQKNGRDVAVLISAAEYIKMQKANDNTDLIMKLHEESIEKFDDLYTELAK